MHVVNRLEFTVWLLAVISVMTGCRSNLQTRQAINNLRAEKIQLENQYYLLKSQYEADMRRLGQPIQIGGPALSTGSNFSGPGMASGLPVMQQPTLASGLDMIISDQDMELARYIQDVEISQLPENVNEFARLLIRPLDDQGDVIPMAGDVTIELIDPATNMLLANYHYSRPQIAGMMELRSDQYPGIHLGLPPLAQAGGSAGSIVCRLQFRTADNRMISQQAPLTAAGNAAIPTRSTGSSVPARQASTPVSDTPQLTDVIVEIGDETNFDMLDSGTRDGGESSRPAWSPDR